MAGFLAKFVATRLLKENAQNRFGQEDPYFEEVPATRLDGRPSKKTKKVKKRLPPGLSDHDAKILNKVKRRAYRLDLCLFSIMGIRFGWSSVIGLIPFAGDVVDALMAKMVISTAKQVEGGLPSHIVTKMYINLLIDFGVGLVPFVGDVLDAVIKCNTKNAVLLEEELRKRGKARLKAQHQQVPYDPSLPEDFDRESDEEPPRRGHRDSPPSYDSRYDDAPTQPPRAHTNSKGRGYFGGDRERDIERGESIDDRPPQPSRQKSRGNNRRY